MKFIVGLGNPGERYQFTRHNFGWLVLDDLAVKHNATWQLDKKFKAEICQINDWLLIKPQTMMNNSGISVRLILDYFKVLPKSFFGLKQGSDLADILTVIHDDLDIVLGKYKQTTDSRSAGHNGVQSIMDYLKTQKFNRFRLGIRTDELDVIPADKFVLQRFSKQELEMADLVVKEVVAKILI